MYIVKRYYDLWAVMVSHMGRYTIDSLWDSKERASERARWKNGVRV